MRHFKYRNLVGPKIRLLRLGRGWTQADLALRLQFAGWNISRCGVAKIEARINQVKDHELCYLRQVLRVEIMEMFPILNPHKTIREGIADLMSNEIIGELANPEYLPRLFSPS